MDNFKEYKNKIENREVIISYDITSDFNKFRSDLLKLMDKFGKIEITESTYKLKNSLNGTELENLRAELVSLFEKHKKSLNEASNRPKKVRVVIIISLGNTFIEEVLIDEVIS